MERIPIQERIDNFKLFYKMANTNGPLVGFYLDSYYPLIRFRTKSYLKSGIFTATDLNVNAFMKEYERLFNLYESFRGDFLWSAPAFWGVPWLEAITGCKVFADYETGSTRSIPPDKEVKCADDIPDFSIDNLWVKKTQEFLIELTKLSNNRFPLATTLMRGISDIFSAIFQSPQFIYRFMDDPNLQKDIAAKLTDIWIKYAKAQLDLIPLFYGGVGSFFYSMWMPGRGVWLQEDAAAMLSPEIFGDFILPCIDKIVSRFDSSIIHLHPSSYIPVEFLVETDLTAIELHIDYGGPRASELFEYYKKILSCKPLVIWGDLNKEDIDFIKRHLDRESIAVMPVVKNISQAEHIWRFFKNVK